MSVSGRDPIILRGRIVSGTGKGGYYLRKEEFCTQFERILGKRPYPGTLNVEVDGFVSKLREAMDDVKRSYGITIQGFKIDGKDYFPGISLSCTLLPPPSSLLPSSSTLPSPSRTPPPSSSTPAQPIQDIPALIFFPEQTIHPPEILEIISTQRLLDVYEMGQNVTLKV